MNIRVEKTKRTHFLGIKLPVRIVTYWTPHSIDWDIDFTWTKQFWIEIELYKNKWWEINLKEIYTPLPEHQVILGSSDTRTVFNLGFRVPFRKEK